MTSNHATRGRKSPAVLIPNPTMVTTSSIQDDTDLATTNDDELLGYVRTAYGTGPDVVGTFEPVLGRVLNEIGRRGIVERLND